MSPRIVKLLIRIEKLIETSAPHRLLFFAFCTLCTIGFMGYHFGTFDQASHIPFLRQMADPSLYPGDALVPLWRVKYSYFWQLFIPVFRMGLLEPVLFGVYVMSVFLTFAALWRLAMIVFASSRIATLFTFIMMFPHFGFGYFNIFEFSLVNRVVMFPLVLFCIGSYLQKKYLWVFVVLGIIFNFHALSVVFVLIMFGFDMVLRWREVGVKTIIQSGLLFVIGASPVLAWKTNTTGVSLLADYPWFQDVNQGMLMHIYSIFNIWPPFIVASVNGVLQIAFSFLYSKEFGSGFVHRVMRHFLWAISITVIMHTISTILYPSVFIIQFQLLRISIFLIVFFYLYATAYLMKLFENKNAEDREIVSVIILLFSSVTTYIYAIAEFLHRRNVRGWGIRLIVIQLLSFVAFCIYLYPKGMFMPGVYIHGRNTPSVDAQKWVQRNTAKDAMIIAPPYLWSLYDADWRVFSQRSTVVTWGELLEIAFVPDVYPDWVRRFDDMLPGARRKFYGHFTENQVRIREEYLSLKSEDVLRLALKYHASYFVTEKAKLYPYPLVYENAVFRVYDIRGIDLVIDGKKIDVVM